MSLEPFPFNNYHQDDLESPRLFPFIGSDKAYIAFLENQFINTQWTGFTGFDKSLVHGATIDEVSQADGLEIVQYAPGLSQSKVSETAVPRWKKELFTFISALPTEKNWQKSRGKAGINESHKNWLALRWLLGYPNTPTPHTVEAPATRVPVLHKEDQALVLRGHYYAEFMQHCTNDISFTTSVVSFQSLIFVSYCVVMIQSGVSKETTNHLMRRYFSIKNDDQTLEGYRRGSVWVNRCASELLVHGWGHKSWELFLLETRSLAQFARFAVNDARSYGYLVQQLGRVDVPLQQEGWIPYCIPCIVHSLAGEIVDLNRICDILGYGLEAKSKILALSKQFMNAIQNLAGEPIEHLVSNSFSPSRPVLQVIQGMPASPISLSQR